MTNEEASNNPSETHSGIGMADRTADIASKTAEKRD